MFRVRFCVRRVVLFFPHLFLSLSLCMCVTTLSDDYTAFNVSFVTLFSHSSSRSSSVCVFFFKFIVFASLPHCAHGYRVIIFCMLQNLDFIYEHCTQCATF